jgi:hypothetical protein
VRLAGFERSPDDYNPALSQHIGWPLFALITVAR